MAAPKTQQPRFHLEGNRLVITTLFDPRYQRGAEMELLNTLQALLEEQGGEEIILDLHLRSSFPSMLIGIVVESCRRVGEAGAKLTVRIRPEHRRSFEWAGMQRMFREGEQKMDDNGVAYLEFVGKSP